MSWLHHWGINENGILLYIDNVKNIITSKFKEKLWCEENLVVKRKLRYYKEIINHKLRYYKEVINHELEDQKYLFAVTSSWKKINIAKIRTNSHEIHRESGC